ncbi:MAG: OsmC family protein [Pseudomonadota bacterium]
MNTQTHSNQTPADTTTVNGIHLETLQGTVQAIAQDPELGQCKFRARNAWLGGSRNCTTVTGFYGAKQEIAHKQTFELHADEPPILAGNDNGANPVEHLLNALAACVTTSMVAHAAVRGIHIEELESELEGDIDLRGFLGLDEDVPKGFTDIRMKFRVKADIDDMEQLKQLSEYSPVFNTLTQGTNVDIQVVAK